jgi:hypothetical protein
MINTTIAKLALQALLGRRRFFLLLAFPVLLIGLVALVTALVDGDAAYEVLPNLGYPLVLPLVAILAASSVLGPEVDDGSIVYLLSKPVNRYGIAISKWLVALGATQGGTKQNEFTFTPFNTAQCTALADQVVTVKPSGVGRRVIRGRTETSAGTKDRDTVKLRCLAAP